MHLTSMPAHFEYIFVVFFRHSSKAARGRPYVPVPGGPPQCKVFTDLPHSVLPMLMHLGPHLSTDPILMAKILRITKGFMKDVSSLTFIAWVFTVLCTHCFSNGQSVSQSVRQ